MGVHLQRWQIRLFRHYERRKEIVLPLLWSVYDAFGNMRELG